MSNHWTTDSARHTYAVPHWGDGYVDVSAAGEIVMRPRGTGGPALSLPQIVERLREIGIIAHEGKRSPSRFAFSDDTIADIKTASEECGLPGTVLLLAGLRLFCNASKSRRGRKGGAK